jgi:hypothetical protein
MGPREILEEEPGAPAVAVCARAGMLSCVPARVMAAVAAVPRKCRRLLFEAMLDNFNCKFMKMFFSKINDAFI